MRIYNTPKGFLAVIIPLILLSQSYTAFGATDKIALNIDRSVYSIDMQVTIIGQVLGSFDPDSPAKITVTGPSGNSYHSASVGLDSSGGFTHQFKINEDVSLIGKNTVEVTHQTISGKVSGTLTFEVRDRASMTIQMNKDSYELGEDVILQGRVSPLLPDSQVIIQVFNPKDNAWTFQSVSSNNISPDGQFTVELGNLSGERSIVGTYTVKAFYADSTASVTETFSVVDSDSQAQSNKTKQSGQSTGTPPKVEVVENGSATTAAEVSKETIVQSEIKNTDEHQQEFTYIVLIKDSVGLTASLSWTKGMLDPSQSLTMEQSWIPETPGEYTAEIFVWESFDNPVALSDKIVKMITVE